MNELSMALHCFYVIVHVTLLSIILVVCCWLGIHLWLKQRADKEEVKMSLIMRPQRCV